MAGKHCHRSRADKPPLNSYGVRTILDIWGSPESPDKNNDKLTIKQCILVFYLQQHKEKSISK